MSEVENKKRFVKKAVEFSNSWTGTIIIVLLVIFFVAQAFVIPSGSMKNTLLIGDNLFVKKFSYGIPIPRIPWIEVPILPDFDGDGHIFSKEGPKRGDIVIFRYPEDEKIHYVKRCVAVGGDWVLIVDKNLFLRPHEGNDFVRANYPANSIYDINGYLWVKNPYANEHVGIHFDENVIDSGIYPPQIFNLGPIVVPENEYFMMGDNRDHSNDSRFWGFVPYKYIVGKPWFIYFSMDENYKIRWDRMFKSVETIESEMLKTKYGN